MADNIMDLLSSLNKPAEPEREHVPTTEQREFTQVKEIMTNDMGHMSVRFISLQEALQIKMKKEVEAHDDENFEGDGIFDFVTGKHEDAAYSHEFSFKERANGRVFKFRYK